MNKVLYTWDHIIDENGNPYQEWITKEEAIKNDAVKSDMMTTLLELSVQQQNRMKNLHVIQ